MAQAEAKTEKKTRGKKGEGPVTVSYLDEAGKSHTRVPEGVVAVQVANKDGSQTKTYKIDELPASVTNMLATMMLGKRFDIFVRNSIKNDDKANVLELSDSVYANLKSGKVYTRAEGAGATGRPFDYNFWVDVVQDVAKVKKQTITEKQIATFKNKLESFAPADRRKFLQKMGTDRVFALSTMRIRAERAKQTVKEEGAGDFNAMDELF